MKLQNKNILIYSNQGLSALNTGYELEIIDNLIANNNIVTILTCNSKLDSCFFNPTHNLIGCSICESRTRKEFKKRFGKVEFISLKRFKAFEQFNFNYTELDDLIKLEYDNINIGRGIASSIISHFREYELKRIDNINEIIKLKYNDCIKLILNFKEIFSKRIFDAVYLFNGRFSEHHVLIEYCKIYKIDFYTYDTGLNRRRYILRKNSTVHSIKRFQEDLIRIKKSNKYRCYLDEGTKIFENRIKGNMGDVLKFNTFQKKTKLPRNFNENKINVAIFNSSEDEVKVIEEWEVEMYKNQNEALNKIFNHFKNKYDYHFYLRVHPNLYNINNSQLMGIKKMKYDNVTIILSDSNIDTYALINVCDKIITFGSTVGLEASMLNKASILFGTSFYKGFDWVYEPKQYSELYNLIENQELKPKSNEFISLFFYTLLNIGTPIKYVNYISKNEVYYDKQKIKRVSFNTILYFIRYLVNVIKWVKFNRLYNKSYTKDLFKLKSHTNEKVHLISK